MAEGESSSLPARTLEFTPTWALVTVTAFFVLISMTVERSLSSLGHYFKETKRKPLYAALQKMKDELMLMGFISLTITILQEPVSKVCIPATVYNKWTPCSISKRPPVASPASAPVPAEEHRRRLLATESSTTSTCREGYEPFASPQTLHELHIFIIVLALFHVTFSCLTMLLALLKVYRWRKWEREAHMHATASQSTPTELLRRVTYRRQSTFVRYHTSQPWSRSRFIVWVICFFQQFYIPRSDYMALRLSFITTHNLRELYDFHAYMVRTLEDEFETIVGISSWLWGCVLVLWAFNVDGTHLYFWISLIPLVVVFIIGTKLQHVVATLALENSGVPGPLVAVLLQPRDQLFWFNRPKLLLYVIHLVLFETALEIAIFVWHVWQFGYRSCLLDSNKAYVYGRLVIGMFVLLFSSYSTLPLYALVTQMGSNYKKAIVSKNVERVLKQWHKDAKQRLRVASASDASEHSTPSSSSLILHFKSQLRSSQAGPSSQPRNLDLELGPSARHSSTIDVREPEENSLNRAKETPAKRKLTARSIWERRHEQAAPSTERAEPSKSAATKTMTTTTAVGSAKLQFLTPHPAFQGRALQRQLSLPMEILRR